jgi:hypothetical protein
VVVTERASGVRQRRVSVRRWGFWVVAFFAGGAGFVVHPRADAGQGAAPAAVPAAQAPGGRGAQAPAVAPVPPPTPKAAAPIDLVGVWVSVVTEDWRWRMVTPSKGDYASIPINQAARTVGDGWDPAKDEAAGEACKAYGAPGLMRLPGRLRISWQDDTTLKLETDAGTQTRLFHFGDWKPTAEGPSTRQGDTVAQWEGPPAARGAGPPTTTSATPTTPAAPATPPAPRFGNLKTVTTRLLPGYLRKNGVPFSDKTTLTEYWDLLRQADGTQWVVVTTIAEDPTYLSRSWITSLNFKKEPNGSKWDPAPCMTK